MSNIMVTRWTIILTNWYTYGQYHRYSDGIITQQTVTVKNNKLRYKMYILPFKKDSVIGVAKGPQCSDYGR